MRGVFGPGTIVLGGGAVLLIGFLALGFFLPGTWTATVESTLSVPTSRLRPYLDAPEGWRAWTTWPDSGLTRSGPERGAGARMAWDDPDVGSGSFTIEAVEPDGGVTYAVEVAGEAGSPMRTRGRIDLRSEAGRTEVRWTEEGDLGSNPLMGYWALFMERAQSAEMSKSLERLEEVAAGDTASTAPGGSASPAGPEARPAGSGAHPADPDTVDSTSSPGPTR